MAILIRSIGTASTYNTGTISVDVTGLIVTLTTGTFPSTSGTGDALVIDVGGTPETRFLASRDSDSQVTLQTASTRTSESGLSYTLDRSYSTITDWEADCSADLVTDQNIWKGLCYKDSVFNETVIIEGTTTNASYYKWLSVAEADRHTGTAGTGVVIDTNGGTTDIIHNNEDWTIIEWLEITDWGTGNAIDSTDHDACIRNCILHDSGGTAVNLQGSYYTAYVLNNIIYNLTNNSSGMSCYYRCELNAYNNTVYNCTGTGIRCGSGDTDILIYNNICIDNGDDFAFGVAGTLHDYNISSDATATGTNSLTGQTTTDVAFVNVTGGSEDLHIASGSSAINEGTDLGTTCNVNIDINGYDRDAGGVVWDIGAHEYIAIVTGAAIPIVSGNGVHSLIFGGQIITG